MTTSDPIAGLHLVRYGTPADQKFLLGEFLKTYDQLVINANMVAHAPAALASFLLQRAKNKPYFIDPQTHAFQHDVTLLESDSPAKEGELRRSVRTLIQAYGEPVHTRVEKSHTSVLPADFSNSSIRRGFCERVIGFQITTLSSQATSGDTAKYYRFLAKKGVTVASDFGPSLVVAPYFYMDAATLSDWLPVNISLAKDAAKIAASVGKPLGIQIVISQNVLSTQALIESLISQYAQTQPAVFLLWVDAFSEQLAAPQLLDALIRLINQLCIQAPVVNLYGGYFSVALARSKRVPRLVGVVHGPEYGEDRSVVPVGGGIPVAKFYLPGLHTRLAFRDAVRAVRALGGFNSVRTFLQKICDCKECTATITGDPTSSFALYGQAKPVESTRRGTTVVLEYPLPETKAHCVRHYMWSKAREYQEGFSASGLAKQLSEYEKTLGRVLSLGGVVHCRIWREMLASTTDQ